MVGMQWLKGHGTENDFIVVPDHDGTSDLDPAFVAALCDRRTGLGADGVLRVVTAQAAGIESAGTWFMDYRNADGSISQMCGNGVRVFARHLVDEGLETGTEFAVATRDGDKFMTLNSDGTISVDMGPYVVGGTSAVTAEGHTRQAREVHTGNPHAVVFVESVDDAGTLLVEPHFDASVYPEGVNIEFVETLAPAHVRMRVHERGSGETRSCGTGACAVGIAVAQERGLGTYRVDVPGGTLLITVESGRTILTGPAVIVARGELEWLA
jgi:diaminopimelate epimerase